MQKNFKLLALAASLSAIGLPTAHAVDFNGYFRAGPHSSTESGVNRATYALASASEGAKYRLGNELDTYGEFALSEGGKAGSVEYKATLMTNFYNPGNGDGGTKVGVNQIFAEAKGFDIAPASTFWIGQRFYGRADVHIVDTFYTNLSGTGAGVDTPVGPGTLGVAYFRQDGGVGTRINVDYSGLPVNPGGKLRIVGTYTNSDQAAVVGVQAAGTDGFGLTVQHTQDNFLGLGGANTAWIQFAQGSAGLNANFGNPTSPSGTKGFRIVESLTWQIGPLGGQAQAMVTDEKDAGVKTRLATIGGRVSYAFTNNFKLLADTGYSQWKRDGLPTEKLAKFTIAPTLSTGPGFWNRPELRLFVTTAKWNGAANKTGVLPAGLAGTGSDKTTGTSYGFQAEMWF
jgi:maltoporin